ncbi:MAG: serine protease, partial [Clostridia bacterium]|nr:serine protease [Clostridia bacterium]
KTDGERSGRGRGKSEVRAARGRGYIVMICVCLFVSLALLLGSFYSNNDGDIADSVLLTESTDLSDTSTDNQPSSALVAMSGEEIYARSKNSVVTVASYSGGQSRYYSGFGIFLGGYIATLYEAISDSEQIEVVLSNGVAYPAKIIGGDATVNLALIQCEAMSVDCVSIASGEEVRAGERAYAVGSMGEGKYGASFASCEISCERRTPELIGFDGYRRVFTAIQLDAINDRCMMGAPVFNEYGQAVAVVLSAGEDCLQSFALPIDGVYSVLESVMLGESPTAEALSSLAYIPPTLGILGEQVNEGDIWGVAVRGFLSDTCDASLKLRVGDIIFKINDTLVPDAQTLALKIQEYIPDDEVEVFVLRDGQRLSFKVKLTKNQ